ncbi:BON domain-containing protein [Tahibacter harae]|uniref:BON domain-containing protein n=1 Tax=Tahibacter harae TaxID=2963937 RepID=A0ABT1QTI8_9GAMM|nr:BON domain-containing protein [Tahibacter harae]MCQ4165591.1 BON domain-containing protein [Tahibacter harae]
MNRNDTDQHRRGRGQSDGDPSRARGETTQSPASATDPAERQRHPSLRWRAADDRRDPRDIAAYAGVQRGAYGRYDEDDWQPRDHDRGYGEYEAERRLSVADERQQRAQLGVYDEDPRGRYAGGPPHYRAGYAEAIAGAPGAGAYGRPRGRPGEDFRGRGPRGYVRSDERVREDVSECLAEDPYVDASNIDVVVREGVVTLSGSIAQRRLKHRAEDLAGACRGVREVDNRLRVAPYPETGPVENT